MALTSRKLLILALALIALIWQLPHGHQILYPFTLFATAAHELGHGLTALLFGARFEALFLHADGSGMAVWQGSPGRIGTALIAAGGLLGPTLAGTLLLLAARNARRARGLLLLLAGLLLLCTLLWARNVFAIVFLLASATLFALGAKVLSDALAAFFLHFLAALLCLSWFRDLDYLFSDSAIINGRVMLSDTAAISQALWLPYWFWGGTLAGLSFLLLAGGLWLATRQPGA